MKTIIAHLQKYYGVYLLILAVVFMILWLPNRMVNRYAISATSASGMEDSGGIFILDTRTGQVRIGAVRQPQPSQPKRGG